MWLCVDGECDHKEFAEKVDVQMNALGKSSDLKRYYTQDSELFHWDGKTYAFTNQVSIGTLSILDGLLKEYRASGIAYHKSVEE
jgi:ABC-type glycerol-3-phosphate transport system substrate-binding protein